MVRLACFLVIASTFIYGYQSKTGDSEESERERRVCHLFVNADPSPNQSWTR